MAEPVNVKKFVKGRGKVSDMAEEHDCGVGGGGFTTWSWVPGRSGILIVPITGLVGRIAGGLVDALPASTVAFIPDVA
jgi:hypothetical protein